ncbi:nucleotidyltransferase family protein [Sphingobacterium sp. lm-10]|uniref:nucleotidyltransferase family protein n=1 Tax=Sphingobacterium sp. lm-10 TaxID=2944904 RepID=UPI002020C3C5|nr:nucleotidyltransferase family protein [Sphingobacterium sp. lm-10]
MKARYVFLTLLRSGLWNQPVTDFEGFPLSAEQWKELFNVALSHTVEGLLYQGVVTLPDHLLPPRSLILSWTVRIEQIEQRNRWMDKQVNKHVDFFSAHNLYPYLLKGQGVARCYEKPNVRLPGDIDWFFQNKKDYKLAREVLTEEGVAIASVPGFSTYAIWNDVEVELHRRMIDIHNPFKTKYIGQLYQSEADFAQSIHYEGYSWSLPSPLLMHVSVSIHILKHLLAYGIGLRQLCDAARVCYTHSRDLSPAKLVAVYQSFGVLKFIHVLHGVLVEYLGLPEDRLPFPRIKHPFVDTMMQDIWTAGNFGFSADSNEEKNGSRHMTNPRIWKNLLRYLPLARMEAISFPVVQFYSRFSN